MADQSDGGSHPAKNGPSRAHHDLVGQPHDPAVEGPIAQAETVAAEISSEERPMGRLGRRFNWRSPFFVGMTATAGVAVTVAAVYLFLTAGSVIVLIGLALFLAFGMEPAVSWLVTHKFPRWAAVLTVLFVIVLAVGAFIAAAVPALVAQGEQLVADAPQFLQEAQDSNSLIGQLNERFQLQDKLESILSSSSSGIVDGVLGAGAAVFGALADTLVVFVLTAYFLADLPRIRSMFYRLVFGSRRPRAILIGDDILAKVGGYVLGNLVISVIAGVLTFIWLIAFGVPYAFLLSILVALLDLVPVVGSTIAGIVVAAVALSVSLPVCLLTIAFFVIYRFVEDYFLVPKILGKAVEVPALVTVVAVLIGAALLGIVGALVAIPVSAALLLIARVVLFPRLDQA
ncbi:MAG: AI-2E family transporter [Nakamurella sp.]